MRCWRFLDRASLHSVWVVLRSAVVKAVEVVPLVFALDRTCPGVGPGILPPWHTVPKVDVMGEGLAHPLRTLAH